MSENPQDRSRRGEIVSILTVFENDRLILPDFIHETLEVLSKRHPFHEIVLVDLHSTDGSLECVLELMRQLPNLRLIRLSSYNDLEVGLAAALDHCIGDYAIIMNPYLDRPGDIPRMIEAAQQGFEVVIAQRVGAPPGSRFKRMFYSLASRMLEIRLDPNESGFRLLTRKVVTSLTKIKNRRRYLRYFNALLNFKPSHLTCQVHDRARLCPRPPGLFKSLRRAVDILISHSAAPLRWTAGLGLLASFGNLIYLLYVFIVLLIKEKLAEGWLTTSVLMSTMFFGLFLILTVLSEYVARIMEELQGRPLYFIEMEAESTVASPGSPLNVVESPS